MTSESPSDLVKIKAPGRVRTENPARLSGRRTKSEAQMTNLHISGEDRAIIHPTYQLKFAGMVER